MSNVNVIIDGKLISGGIAVVGCPRKVARNALLPNTMIGHSRGVWVLPLNPSFFGPQD
jgi:hypothetical protein